MVSEVNSMSNKIDVMKQIKDCVKDKKHFLLSGGAGCGKTYTLVETIKHILETQPNAKIACITYTNAATDEIKGRVDAGNYVDNLRVSTIHDFLWDNIKNYKVEIKPILIELDIAKKIKDNFLEPVKESKKNTEQEKINQCLPEIENIKQKINSLDDAVNIISEVFNAYKAVSYKCEPEFNSDYNVDNIAQKIYDRYNELCTIKPEEIRYSETRNIKRGIISHDDVIAIANYMYGKYEKLCKILTHKYNIILIDEYQDTFQEVVEIFLKSLHNYQKDKAKKIIFGFYGDSMQNIYEKGCGNIKNYIEKDIIKEIQKQDNFRSAPEIIEVINNIRKKSGDNLVQERAGDKSSERGTIKVLYTTRDNFSVKGIEENLAKDNNEWDFDDKKTTKKLYLTHKLVAKEKGFLDVFNEYNKKDDVDNENTGTKNQYKEKAVDLLFDDAKLDIIVKTLYSICKCISLYKSKNIYELLKHLDKDASYRFKTISDKKTLGDKFLKLIEYAEDKSIADVIEYVMQDDDFKALISDETKQIFNDSEDKLDAKQKASKSRYDKIKEKPFELIQKAYYHKENDSIQATQHSVKGEEFDNVLVILDNGEWSSYNFTKTFNFIKSTNEEEIKATIKERTLNILYVACSRAKKNLALLIYGHKIANNSKSTTILAPEGIITLEEIFGAKNCINLDE